MALAKAIQGGLRPAQEITWLREDGEVEDLTDATITGTIREHDSGDQRAIAGTLTVTDGAAGVFVWAYAAADVATAGRFTVQFNAAFGAEPSPAKTTKTSWEVSGSL